MPRFCFFFLLLWTVYATSFLCVRVFFFFYLPTQEDYDHVSLEEHYKGDGSMLSPKAKLLLRESKKELLRYAPTQKTKTTRKRERERKEETPQWTLTKSPVNNRRPVLVGGCWVLALERFSRHASAFCVKKKYKIQQQQYFKKERVEAH